MSSLNTSSLLSSGGTSSSPLQSIGGLASGLDTNTIISQLMAVERNPQVLIQQRLAVDQVRQSALTSVQSSLQSLQTAINGMSDPTLWTNSQSVTSNDTTKITASYTVGAAGAAPGGYNLTVSQLARAQQLTQATGLTAATAADTLHISLGGGSSISVTVQGGATIQQIADAINKTVGVPVFAAVDATGKLVLSGKQTGAANTIAVTSDGTLATDLGLAQTQAGLDASYTLDGVPKTSASNTVTTGIAGVTLGLVGVTSSPVTILVGAPGANTSAVQSRVQAFVDAYNGTVSLVQGYLTDQPVPNPKSASDRAKGVLFGDPGLTQLLASLREAVGGWFGGNPSGFQSMSQVGLSTGASTGSAALNQDSIDGKLTLDSTALGNALGSNLNGVKALFTNVTGSASSEGLVQRLGDQLNPYLVANGVMDSRLASESAAIKDLTSQSADWDQRLSLKEQQLRTQFTNMEVALSNAQSASAQLSAAIAKLG